MMYIIHLAFSSLWHLYEAETTADSFNFEVEWIPYKGSLLHSCGLFFSREAEA